jgi:histidinol-phosphate aminotransferase
VIAPRPEVLSLKPYQPGRPQGFAATNPVNLAANENAWGPSPAARAALATVGDPARYPDMTGERLISVLASAWDVSPASLLLGTGSGHLIKCLAETYLRPGDVVVTVSPTFSLYEQAARLMGATVAALPGDGHTISFERLPEWVARVRPRLVYLCSPNNPTGDMAPLSTVTAVLESLSDTGLLVVDEAYAPFAETEPDWREFLAAGAPLALLRTFSKIHGLAALRLGVLVAPPPVVAAVGRVREPFPANSWALAAATAAVQDREHLAFVAGEVARGRRRLLEALAERHWEAHPSQANFVWAAPPPPWEADKLVAALRERGILIRAGSPFGVATHVRITVGRAEEIERFLRAVDELEAERL